MLQRSNLHPYQEQGVNHIIDNNFVGLFLDMGLGKTVTTLTAITKLMYEELEVGRVLIVAPKRVAETVWTSEIENWSHLSHLKTSRVIGTAAQREEALQAKADIFLIGRDNVSWLVEKYGRGLKLFDMLIVDESSSFKNAKSLRFKALKSIQPFFKRVVILTGTPAPNGLIDLWPQIYLLDRGERLGKTLTSYRDTYFEPDQRNGYIVYNYRLKKGAADIIHKRIGDVCMSMKASDYLQLPERIDNIIKIDFTPELREAYDTFEEEQVLLLDEEITALNAAALSTKLQQYANGSIYDDVGTVQHVHDLKLNVAEELIESAAGKPVLIAWTFKHDRDRLKKAFKNAVELKGENEVKAWNRGEIPILLTHPASGGHGLNLQAGGCLIVWFGDTWNLELHQQLNARLHRQGQQEIVVINRLVISNTIDDDIIKSLDRKDKTQETLMQAVKRRRDKYVKNNLKIY